jgi:HEPN superfamily AbiU2-like protein
VTEFETELETFRKEEESAQQFFFAYLSVRTLAGGNPDVRRMINTNSLFWVTVHYAMLVAAFVALGRIFDQDSKHNIDRLMGVASKDLSIFSLDALRARKEALNVTPEGAAEYVVGKHELTSADVRLMRKQIDLRRRIYEERYRDIRHKVFAHKATDEMTEINEMFAKTNIEEMKALFGFLHALHKALWEVFNNGLKPVVRPHVFVLSPEPAAQWQTLPAGERVFREAHAVLRLMVTEDVK